MSRRLVRLSPRAEDDFRDIVDWISKHSTAGARSWIDAYVACEAGIADRPMACGLAPESRKLGRDLRLDVRDEERNALPDRVPPDR